MWFHPQRSETAWRGGMVEILRRGAPQDDGGDAFSAQTFIARR
jgi:hypothetical protein